MLIHNFIEYYGRSYPDYPAITQDGKTISYSELDELANRLANGLTKLGIGKGDRIAYLAENSPEHFILFQACGKIGAVAVGLNTRLAAPEHAFIINDSKSKALFFASEGLDASLERLKPILPENCHLIMANTENNKEWRQWLNEQSDQAPKHAADEHDKLLQLYTSGTTGNHKGVALSHKNLLAGHILTTTLKSERAGPGSADLVVAPLFHTGGAGAALITLISGAELILHKTFDPEAVVRDIEQYPITAIMMVPAMIMAVLSLPNIESRDFSKLKLLTYGASPIAEGLLRRALEIFQVKVTQMYGMTESTGAGLDLSFEAHQRALNGEPHLLRSAGRPSVGMQVKIADANGDELPRGEVGEIWMKSDTIMEGYYNLPEETEKSLTDGWLHTGDMASMDEEGFVYIKDRLKDMVVSGGENIYPVEVESVLSLHPDIVDIAVIGVPDDSYGEALLACIVPTPDTTLKAEDIVEFCRPKIAGYKIPRQLKLMDALPRSATGKVLKKELREPYWKGATRSIN